RAIEGNRCVYLTFSSESTPVSIAAVLVPVGVTVTT
ncbi:hypothetical protein MGSAQ_001888, partial [marine sediment metagenome]